MIDGGQLLYVFPAVVTQLHILLVPHRPRPVPLHAGAELRAKIETYHQQLYLMYGVAVPLRGAEGVQHRVERVRADHVASHPPGDASKSQHDQRSCNIQIILHATIWKSSAS